MICLLETEVPRALQQAHDSVLGGHYGKEVTLKRLERAFWWPSMRHDVNSWVERCMRCAQHGPRRASFNRVPVAARQPFEWVQIDWILGMPVTPNGNRCIIVAIDGMTGYMSARAYPDTSSAATVEFVVNEIILKFGIPQKIQTDNGSHFHGAFQALCDKWRIKQSWSAAYSPSSHGRVERGNQEILVRLRKMCEGDRWDHMLAGALFAINTRRTRRRNASPAELLYGITPRGPVEINALAECDMEPSSSALSNDGDRDNAARLVSLNRTRQSHVIQRQRVARAWTRTKPINLQPGDAVLYWVEKRTHKLAPRWAGPAIVKWVGTKGAVGVKMPGRGRPKIFAAHQVKLCTADTRAGAPIAGSHGTKRTTESRAMYRDRKGSSGSPPSRRQRK